MSNTAAPRASNGPAQYAVRLRTLAALEEARELDEMLASGTIVGPLHGVPILLKDNIESSDPVPTTAGSLALANNLTGDDMIVVFDDLKAGLAAPLSGMGTAFSSSLFGLGGSLVLGFLDLQAGHAQNRFFNGLEEWLTGVTQLIDEPGLAESAGLASAEGGEDRMAQLIHEMRLQRAALERLAGLGSGDAE